MDILLNDRYVLGAKIDEGSFGEIFIGRDSQTKLEVAIKLEPRALKRQTLLHESRLYRFLGGKGRKVPRLHWSGAFGEYNAMVIDLLGPSLKDLFNYCNRKIGVKTALVLADQVIEIVEYVHSKGIIHRDIKPENFLIGLGAAANDVHLVDFGLAKEYLDPATGFHIPFRENRPLIGTARYVSLNTHLGIEQSRRDDLEAVGHVMVYLLCGGLPWQGMAVKSKQEMTGIIMVTKAALSPEALCKGLPDEFATYLSYCRKLGFDEDPDYNYLRNILQDLFARENFLHDHIFDWSLPRSPPKKPVQQTAT